MKKSIILIVALTICIVTVSCNKSAKSENKFATFEKTGWLVGTWENTSDDGTLSESWEKINDSLYQGHGYFIKGKDTLHHETIELRQKGDEVSYNVSVKGQNENKPVAFKMTLANEKQLVFENPSHDYPKKIVYNKITNDSLVAEISGIQQGKSGTEKYPMKRK